MSKLVLFVVFVLAVFTHTVESAEDPIPPLYETWTSCFGEEIYRICFEGDSPFNTNNVVAELREKESKERALLIWSTMERSKNVFRIHNDVKSFQVEVERYYFYRWEKDQWLLVERKTFRRNRSPKNKPIPLFDKNSSFGRLYTAFMAKNGERADEMGVPTTEFIR